MIFQKKLSETKSRTQNIVMYNSMPIIYVFGQIYKRKNTTFYKYSIVFYKYKIWYSINRKQQNVSLDIENCFDI